MAIYNLQHILTCLPGDPHSNPWCDLTQGWFPVKKWNRHKAAFLTFESSLDYESQLVYFAIPEEWSSSFSSHLILGPGTPVIYFSVAHLFFQSTYIYENSAGLCVCHWDTGMSEAVKVTV